MEQLAAGKAAAGMFGNCSKIKIQPVARLVANSQPSPKESESHRLEGYISSGEQQQSTRKLCRAHPSCPELHRLQPILCQTQQQNAAAPPSLPQSPGAGMYPGCAWREQRPGLLPADKRDTHPAVDRAGLSAPAGAGRLRHPCCHIHHHKGKAPLCAPPFPVGDSSPREAGCQLCPEGQTPGQVGPKEALGLSQQLEWDQLPAVNLILMEPTCFHLQSQG